MGEMASRSLSKLCSEGKSSLLLVRAREHKDASCTVEALFFVILHNAKRFKSPKIKLHLCKHITLSCLSTAMFLTLKPTKRRASPYPSSGGLGRAPIPHCSKGLSGRQSRHY